MNDLTGNDLTGSLVSLLAVAALAAPAAAHTGPPYPILVDEEVGGQLLSIWADPDVGTGTFYLYLPSEEQAPNPDLSVRVFTRPVDGHLGEVEWKGHVATDQPYQRIARPDFDARGPWMVRFALDGPDGRGEREMQVEVTPDGLKKIYLVWFLLPFFLVAFVWTKVVLRRRALEREYAS